MGTNENLLQVNTFIKGMNTDVSDMMLDSQAYRYAENLRLVTDSNSNSGELRMIEGLKKIHTFADGYTPAYLGFVRGYHVAILYKGGSWRIQRSTDQTNWKTIFGDCTEKIWNGNDAPHISAVLNYESDSNIKLYFVDDTGKHGIMSINITKENQGNNIKTLIGNIGRVPEPATIKVSTKNGSLDSPRVLYAYRLYNEFGSASNVSILSKLLSVFKTGGEGFGKIRSTNRAVDISINHTMSFYNKIEIYRIAYYDSGQKPRIFLIRDIDFTDNITITDIGENIHEISVEEFLALDNTEINPKIIENKNNYLFAANLSYARDLVDEKFKDWNATSKCTGLKTSDVYRHELFSDGYTKYDEKWWHPSVGSTKIGGTGTHIDWELVKINNKISRIADDANKDTYHGFKHDETYRFGIILYDEDKRASSVKWIADIRIPPLNPAEDIQINSKDEIVYKTYAVRFNIKSLPKGCSGYEIVRCERKIADKHIMFLGIVGCTMDLYTTDISREDLSFEEYLDALSGHSDDRALRELYIYPSGLFTLQYIYATLQGTGSTTKYTSAMSSKKYLLFACPEYCYLPESSKDILDTYKYNVKLELSHTFDAYWTNKDVNGPYSGNNLYMISKDRPYILPYKWAVTKSDMFTGTHAGNYIYVDPTIMRDNIDTAGYIQPDLALTGIKPAGSNVYCNYIVPKELSNPFLNDVSFTDITDIAYCTSPKWDEFAKELKYIYRDTPVVIGGLQFINWSTPLINDRDLDGMTKGFIGYAESNPLNWGVPNNWDPNRMYYPIGAGGSCILFEMKDREQYQYTKGANLAPISIANIVKDCVPYGGHTKDAIEASVYYSYGDYKEATGTIDIKSGDCHPSIFVYNAAHLWNDALFICACKMSTIYAVPIEADINLNALSGYQYHSNINLAFCVQDEAAAVSGFNYVQEIGSYVYNNVYHILPTVKSFTYLKLIDSNYDTRVHNSDVKSKNETIDNWLRYQPINYIDCDSKYGLITQIDNYKDTLLFWQDKATGIISSNERNIIQNTDGVNLILGNGDVLQRYDYITTIYGMKYGQFANAQSDNSEYWWDSVNKEILQYTKGSVPTPVSTTKGVKTYVQYNNESLKPHVMYDNKYKEVVFNVVNDNSISYTEQLQAFQSVYTYPLHLSTHTDNNDLVVINNQLFINDTNNETGKAVGITQLLPKLKYVVNKSTTMNKVFDIQTFGGRLYGGDNLKSLILKYDTPLKQHGEINLSKEQRITNIEYDFRVAIPRHNNSEYGDRLRGKTMQCELSSTSNSTDFSLQYIITKYRISWS